MEVPVSLNFFRGLIEVYAIITVLRALLQYTDADFHNRFSQLVDRLTRGPIRVLRKIVPRISGSDLGSPFVLAFIITAIERYIFRHCPGCQRQHLRVAGSHPSQDA